MRDLLFRKLVQQRGWNVDALAAEHRLTIGEAATMLGVEEGVVREAIEKGRLATWIKSRWIKRAQLAKT